MEKKEIVLGRNPVLEYIKELSNPAGARLLITKNAHGKIINTIIEESKRKGLEIEYCNKGYLARFESSSRHQGVVLLIPPKIDNISDQEFLKKIHNQNGILLLLDQLTDPRNIGSIIRTAEALGGDGIVIPKARTAEINTTVIKASSGATAHIRILIVSNVANFLESAKKIGFWIIGTGEEGDNDLTKIKELKPALIIIGNEGSGMRRLTKEHCDIIVNIPLKGRISSLNASVAAGIILYEALKS